MKLTYSEVHFINHQETRDTAVKWKVKLEISASEHKSQVQ